MDNFKTVRINEKEWKEQKIEGLELRGGDEVTNTWPDKSSWYGCSRAPMRARVCTRGVSKGSLIWFLSASATTWFLLLRTELLFVERMAHKAGNLVDLRCNNKHTILKPCHDKLSVHSFDLLLPFWCHRHSNTTCSKAEEIANGNASCSSNQFWVCWGRIVQIRSFKLFFNHSCPLTLSIVIDCRTPNRIKLPLSRTPQA